ncbi:MAG: methyltransferase domain-containing protein [Thermoplasmata archaeon]
MGTSGLDPGTWKGVIESLEEFLPYYERANRATTLGALARWRSLAAQTASPEDEVLEIGPGPGSFARGLPCRRVYLLEPSARILRYSRRKLRDPRFVPLAGFAEAIPMRDRTVDKVFCVFSFRDFLDHRRSLKEASRVLRPGGELRILDLFRPPPGLRRKLMDLWLQRGAGTLLDLVVPIQVRHGWKRDPYDELRKTYEAIGPGEAYADLMRELGFERVTATELLLHAVYLLKGVRPSTT